MPKYKDYLFDINSEFILTALRISGVTLLKLNEASCLKRVFNTRKCLIVLGAYEHSDDADDIMIRAREIGAVVKQGAIKVYVLDLKNGSYPGLGIHTYNETTLRKIVQFELNFVAVAALLTPERNSL